jgi:hypothetical protein
MCQPIFRKSSAGSIREGLSAWRAIGASETVLEWIIIGVIIPFRTEPEIFHFRNRHFTAREALFVDKEISELLKSGAIVHCDNKPCGVSSLNVVPKRGESIDLLWT